MKKSEGTSVAAPEYGRFIEELKGRVLSAHISAARHVNRDLVSLYWDIGRGIVEKQKIHDWGDSVVELVSRDLRQAFPQMTGFSPRNVWDMRRMYEAYNAPGILAQVARELGHDREIPILQQPVAE